ncbi:MAG: hypothetical protein GY711_18315 [bacterium]|nr:hypothetical protein [bacterium]
MSANNLSQRPPHAPIVRDDLDQIDDDETIVEAPEIRRAKLLLFGVVMLGGIGFIVTVLTFFQPEGQLVVTGWPNGYRKTRTEFISDGKRGRIEHGKHRAWFESGQMQEEGRYEHGRRTGIWRVFQEDGTLDASRSGHYAAGERVRPLGASGD